MIALILNNGASTPVAKTFSPSIPFGGKDRNAVWVLREGAAPVAYPRVELISRRTPNRASRYGYKVFVPVIETLAGVPSLACTCVFDSAVGYTIPDNAPASAVADLEAYVRNLVAQTNFRSFVLTGDVAFAM